MVGQHSDCGRVFILVGVAHFSVNHLKTQCCSREVVSQHVFVCCFLHDALCEVEMFHGCENGDLAILAEVSKKCGVDFMEFV